MNINFSEDINLFLASKGFVCINEGFKSEDIIDEDSISKFMVSLSSLGFRLDEASILKLKQLDVITFNNLYQKIVKTLKLLKGDVDHLIFYNKFPNMENVSEVEYIFNAIFHYLTSTKDSYGYMINDESFVEGFESYQKLTLIKLIDSEYANKYLVKTCNEMFEQNKIISISEYDVVKEVNNIFTGYIKPAQIPIRANLAMYVELITNGNKDNFYSALVQCKPYISTITDVLRIYATMSNEDCELVGTVFFCSLPRKARAYMIEIIDEIAKNNPYSIDEAASKEFLFKKAFELLHIGEYQKKYPHAYKLAYELRSGNYTTFYSKITKALNDHDLKRVLDLYQIKPGYFARNLDYLLRLDWVNSKEVISSFSKCAKSVSNNVLISLLNHFKNRNNLDNERFIFFRNAYSFISLEVEERRTKIDSSVIDEVILVVEEVLKEKYSTKEFIDGVYLSPELSKYTLPTNHRSASSGFKVANFGTKIKIPNEINSKVLRLFTHWKNKSSRVDIDLSAEFFDSDFNFITSLAWHNMTGGKEIDAYHSGDITTAVNGASEFIDINVEKARNSNIRYILICNCVFTGQSYIDIDECFSGAMFRSELGKVGKLFEAKTVETKFNLTGTSNFISSFVFDTFTEELIWLDVPYRYLGSSIVASSKKNAMSHLIKKAQSKLISIYDLVLLHSGHINFVSDKSKAKFVVDLSDESLIDVNDQNNLIINWIN